MTAHDTVTMATPGRGSERRATRTVIWAAGVAPSSLAGALAQAAGGDVDRAGRLIVEPDLTLLGHPEVLALGDMIAIRRNGRPETLLGLAPVAMQQGRHAGRVVLARLAGEPPPPPFRYATRATSPRSAAPGAVADLRVIRLSGSPAWVTWLAVHRWYLIGFQNRLLVLTRWPFSFLTHGRGARLIGGQSRPQLESPPDRNANAGS